ncbi:Signal transduction histidine kinase [Halobacillus karajensis]|uniref:sensor histidine kinase n=1 Tax=Halobacillus karajensis TaxID=195088 RepID=UPI0008A75537|nr:HAMP domain-containing sensor histidine kinase [Halobacillus karajensis]SEH51071.1 Signal transduction histidine kinase [Halobacillus karajensis]
MKRKLTNQFVFQHVTFLIVSLLLIIGFFIYLYHSLTNYEYDTDFTRATEDYIISNLDFPEKADVEINEKLEENVRRNDGWFQIIDANNGEVVDSVNTPKNVPSNYTIADLIHISKGEVNSNYEYVHWNLENKHLVALYGHLSMSHTLINQINSTQKLSSQSIKQKLKEINGWFVLYSNSGQVKTSFNLNDTYQPLEVLNSSKSEKNFDTATKAIEGQTLIIGVPIDHSDGKWTLDDQLGFSVIINLGIFLLCVIISLFLLSYWHANKWGKPIIHMIDWIENLSEGKLMPPPSHGDGYSNKRKRKPGVFRDIFESLNSLTKELEKSKKRDQELITMREEWISGLSHDLKTPLSSIMGYSLLLENPSYHWSLSELNEIGSTLKQKSEYMNELIEDLSLTYKLKYNALPLSKEKIDMELFIQRCVVAFLNNPTYNTARIEFLNQTKHKIKTFIDTKWFKRIMDNLLANAVKYNDQDPYISVKLVNDLQSFYIIIQDNGVGMDQETIDHLFDRYYRGTASTENQKGSGLGLAITKQLVEAHQGTIKVESRQNKGTQIIMEFPLSM